MTNRPGHVESPWHRATLIALLNRGLSDEDALVELRRSGANANIDSVRAFRQRHSDAITDRPATRVLNKVDRNGLRLRAISGLDAFLTDITDDNSDDGALTISRLSGELRKVLNDFAFEMGEVPRRPATMPRIDDGRPLPYEKVLQSIHEDFRVAAASRGAKPGGGPESSD